jgi:hypothetical protein
MRKEEQKRHKREESQTDSLLRMCSTFPHSPETIPVHARIIDLSPSLAAAFPPPIGMALFLRISANPVDRLLPGADM